MVTEWRVVWVPDPERWGPLPSEGVLGVADLPSAVAQIGLQPGDPVFVSPDFTVDLELLDFVRSRDFRSLERETKRNYATDIRLLLTFLSSRGLRWRAATERDLGDYRAWWCRAPQNPVRVGGSKWNREAAAFTKLFRWAGSAPLTCGGTWRPVRRAGILCGWTYGRGHSRGAALGAPASWTTGARRP